MENKIMCPKCHKLNDIQKFCIFCGKQLFDDEGIKLLIDNPDPYCLNCGRPVKIGQTKCECGYELADINCPECNAKNEYTFKFCTSCGEKLWKPNVHGYKYDIRLFEQHFLNESLPYDLRNLSVYKRSINRLSWIGDNAFSYNCDDSNWQLEVALERLKSKDSNADENLYEICSRWRIVSPNHCIRCLRISSGVCICMAPFLRDKNRIEFLQSEKDYYIEPRFDIEELKFTSKNKPETYLGSLAPAIGESQLEYRERLKWEFSSNLDRKKRIHTVMTNIDNRIKMRKSKPNVNDAAKRRISNPSTFDSEPVGRYCDCNCTHYFEDYILDYDGDGDYYDEVPERYCSLGRSEVYNGGFCEYYNML